MSVMAEVVIFPALSITWPMLRDPTISPKPRLTTASMDFIILSFSFPLTL